jgi:carboxypeptidase C (cathepsin A)
MELEAQRGRRTSPLQLPYVAADLADAMSKNPKLKVF